MNYFFDIFMKKFVQFVSLIVFMMLLNLLAHLIGISFIDGYNKYCWGHFYFFESLFFISIYSVFQIFVFPINKKYRKYVIPIFTLLLFSYLSFSYDPDGFGGELVYMTATCVSKIIGLLFLITSNITNDAIRINTVNILFSVGYSLYLLAVFSSFKYILKYLGSKYPLFGSASEVAKEREP